LAHKDVDARWTKKGGRSYYGYKNHVNMDREMKLVAAHACTDASVHDSQMLEAVLRGPEAGGEGVWADSAYRSGAQPPTLFPQRCDHLCHGRQRIKRERSKST